MPPVKRCMRAEDIRLESIGPGNWREPLEVFEEQKHFVSDPDRILARAYAYREHRSQVRLVLDRDTPVGMLMWYDCPEADEDEIIMMLDRL